jgi:hypothetical protein
MKGEKMLDKMSAHCAALSVASGSKKYIDGACGWPIAPVIRSSRPSILATSISRSRNWIVALISLRAAPESTQESLGANRFLA